MRRRLLLLVVLAGLAWSAFGVSIASADTVGGTSASCRQTPHVAWSGSVVGFARFSIQFRVTVGAGSAVAGRWEHSNGATGPFAYWTAGTHWASTGNTGGANSPLGVNMAPGSNGTARFVLQKTGSYGECFSVASVVVTRTPYTEGGGGGPGGGGGFATPTPTATPGPTPTPTPTAAPTGVGGCELVSDPDCEPPPGYCWGFGPPAPGGDYPLVPCASPEPDPTPTPTGTPPPPDDLIHNDSPWVQSRTGPAYSTYVLTRAFDGNDATDYHSSETGQNRGPGIRFETIPDVSVKCTVTGYRLVVDTYGSSGWVIQTSPDNATWTTQYSGTAGTAESYDNAPITQEYWRVKSTGIPGGFSPPNAGLSFFTWSLYGYCSETGVPEPSPSPTPTPTPDPAATPTPPPGWPTYPSEEPGQPGDGDGFESQPGQPIDGDWDGVGGGGSSGPGGAGTGAGNGLEPCEGEGDTPVEEKVGYVAPVVPREVPDLGDRMDIELPGLNVLDWATIPVKLLLGPIGWLGDVIGWGTEAAQNSFIWVWNTGVDAVVPGECIGVLIATDVDELRAQPPFAYFDELTTAATAGSGTAGSVTIPAIPLPGGGTLALPVDDWEAALSPYRGAMGAIVWLVVALTCIRIIAGSMNVGGLSRGSDE